MQTAGLLTDKDDSGAHNEACDHYFVQPFPVGTTVLAQWVFPGAKVGITVVAAPRD